MMLVPLMTAVPLASPVTLVIVSTSPSASVGVNFPPTMGKVTGTPMAAPKAKLAPATGA